MADAKLTALDALAAPAGGDLLYIVDDPSGTPVSKKITVSDLFLGATPIAVSGGTVTVSTPVFQATQTWNDAGVTFHADDINITNNNSAAASTVLRRRVGGSDVLSVNRSGVITSAASTLILGGFTIDYSSGILRGQNLRADGNIRAGGSYEISSDVVFLRDTADALAQRRGTNAQTSRIYGTYTDGSNYRRVAIAMTTAGVATITPEGAGTGASGNVLHISGLPTSNPGPGILWNNAGTPAIGT